MERAFPSSPLHPPRWNISIGSRKADVFYSFAFVGTYAAKAFIEEVLSHCEYKWVTNDEIEVHSPRALTIKCPQDDGLETIMEYTPKKDEATFILPVPYPNNIRQMLGLSYFAAGSPGTSEPVVTTPRPAKPRQQRSSSERSPIPDGLIPLSDLHKDPKLARNLLRKANFPKPQSGKWLFTPAEAEAARKVLK